MQFHVSSHLEYAVKFPSTLILNIHAQRGASQTILEEHFSVQPPVKVTEFLSNGGENRFVRLETGRKKQLTIDYNATMLAGAFPMVYLIKKYLAYPMEKLGRRLGLESAGAAGLLASMANILAMFRLVREMRPKDKVLNIAFAVCAAFLFGDHLAFTANFQPTLIVPVMLGKFAGGVAGFILAYRLSVPKALQLERQRVGLLLSPAPVPIENPAGALQGETVSAKEGP